MVKIKSFLRELFIGIISRKHPPQAENLVTPYARGRNPRCARNKKHPASNAGFTIAEVLVSAVISVLLLLILLYIPVLAARHWQIGRSQTSILSSIRTSELELTKSIGNSTWGRFNDSNISGIYYFTGDTGHSGEHALLLQSAETIGSSEVIADDNGIPVAAKYILYYIIRPSGDNCPAPASTDNDPYCYHKWLIRKDLALNTFLTIDNAVSIKNKIYTNYVNYNLSSDSKIVAQNILSFDVGISPALGACTIKFNNTLYSLNEPYLQVTLRGFREKEFEQKIAGQTVDLTLDPMMTFSTDDKITPQNRGF